MKTRNIISMFVAAVMSAVAFTSCNFVDDPIREGQKISDKCESSTLSGQWYGNFGMRYTYKWHGSYTTYDSYSTDIVFYPNYGGATSGWGQQVDWYNNGPYRSVQHKFNWSINNGIISLSYPYDHNLDCMIRNYRMDSSTFSGYFTTGSQRFTLTKMLNNYNWGIYTGTYSTKVNVSFSGTFTRGAVSADSIANGSGEASDVDQGTIVKYVNRYAVKDIGF